MEEEAEDKVIKVPSDGKGEKSEEGSSLRKSGQEILRQSQSAGESEDKPMDFSGEHNWRDHGWINCHRCYKDQQVYCHRCLFCYPCAIRRHCSDAPPELRSIFRVIPSDAGMKKKRSFAVIPMNIYVACKKGDIQTVLKLIRSGTCNINDKDENDNTPLYYAILCGYASLVKILVKNGASVDWQSSEGQRYYLAAQHPLVREMIKHLAAQNFGELDKLVSHSSHPSEQEAESEGMFVHLPRDIWMEIFQYLTDQDLISMSAVSTKFRHLTSLDQVWKPLHCLAFGTKPVPEMSETPSMDLDLFFKDNNSKTHTPVLSSYKRSYMVFMSKLHMDDERQLLDWVTSISFG